MTYKYITIVTFTLLSACTQEPQETDKINKSPTNSVPEVNHSNCQFDYIKSISNKSDLTTLLYSNENIKFELNPKFS